ncbi:hypothetical protein D3C85_1320200 [compost metagenome]
MTREAISTPAMAPRKMATLQRFSWAMSTAPLAWCARDEEMAVGMIVASEVATATCIRTEESTPIHVSTRSSTGTMTMPPPTPSSPARRPPTAPVSSIIAASVSRSWLMMSCTRLPPKVSHDLCGLADMRSKIESQPIYNRKYIPRPSRLPMAFPR